MATPSKQPTPPFTLKELQEFAVKELQEEYQEMRKRVRQNGISSLNEGEREFFLNYGTTKSLKPRGSTKE